MSHEIMGTQQAAQHCHSAVNGARRLISGDHTQCTTPTTKHDRAALPRRRSSCDGHGRKAVPACNCRHRALKDHPGALQYVHRVRVFVCACKYAKEERSKTREATKQKNTAEKQEKKNTRRRLTGPKTAMQPKQWEMTGDLFPFFFFQRRTLFVEPLFSPALTEAQTNESSKQLFRRKSFFWCFKALCLFLLLSLFSLVSCRRFGNKTYSSPSLQPPGVHASFMFHWGRSVRPFYC
ncbi:hypothetical protein TcCL_Unassigned05138 [Trypanosoma cruzi]|nr:hypothetical protein TcCL_Unassigned05138 [Trypanosoma cruzi]